MKKEREDWMRLYHKTLKGIEAMIDVQQMMKDMKKIAEETNTIMTKMEGTILMASINNQTLNAMNITDIGRSSIFSSKQHRQMSIPNPKDTG